MDGEGFEPSKAVPTDLQSAPFGHSGIHPEVSLQAFQQFHIIKDSLEDCKPFLKKLYQFNVVCYCSHATIL